MGLRICARTTVHTQTLNPATRFAGFFHPLLNFSFILKKCEKSSPSMSAKPVSKWETPVGNSTASNTESSPTDKCQVTKPSEAATIRSTLFSQKLELENTFPEQFSLI